MPCFILETGRAAPCRGLTGLRAGRATAQLRVPARVAQQPRAGDAASPERAPTAGPAATPADEMQWHGAPRIAPVRQPKQPFVLTPEQEQQLNEALKKWEENSDKIKSFKCRFKRWDYDPSGFGDPRSGYLKSEAEGELKYWAPDHGKYRLLKAEDRVPGAENQPFVKKERDATELEHWVCDGESIFEAKVATKELIQHKLPKELRGKGITDGPLPFVFGAKADQIRRRYFIRLVTPPEEKGKHVWLEAWPKFQSDAANYQRVTISLSEPDYAPHALQVFLPGSPAPGTALANGQTANDNHCNRTVYLFESPLINDKFGFVKFDWLPPWVPPTWKKVVEEAPGDGPEATAGAPPTSPGAGAAGSPASGSATPAPGATGARPLAAPLPQAGRPLPPRR